DNVPGGGLVNPPAEGPPVIELPPIEGAPVLPDTLPEAEAPSADVVPLPAPDSQPAAPLRRGRTPAGPPTAPIMPGSQRVVRISPRNGGPDFRMRKIDTTKDGLETIIVRGGVTVVANMPPPRGTIDLSADSAIIWRHTAPGRQGEIGPDGAIIEDAQAPMEIYLEGHVIARMDDRTKAGPADQKTFQA